MKTILKKIVIWLFEKYAYDLWIEAQIPSKEELEILLIEDNDYRKERFSEIKNIGFIEGYSQCRSDFKLDF